MGEATERQSAQSIAASKGATAPRVPWWARGTGTPAGCRRSPRSGRQRTACQPVAQARASESKSQARGSAEHSTERQPACGTHKVRSRQAHERASERATRGSGARTGPRKTTVHALLSPSRSVMLSIEGGSAANRRSSSFSSRLAICNESGKAGEGQGREGRLTRDARSRSCSGRNE